MGNKPSVNCKRLRNISGSMRAAPSNGLKCKAASFPTCTDPIKQLPHSWIIRHQEFLACNRQREMQVSNFEGDPDGLLPVRGASREKRFFRSFHDQVPIGSDPHDLPRFALHSRRKSNAYLPPLCGRETSANPPALFPSQRKPVYLFAL